MFRGKSYHEMPWSPWDAIAHQGLSNITGLISKLIEVKFKNSLGTVKDLIFSLGELSYIILSRR